MMALRQRLTYRVELPGERLGGYRLIDEAMEPIMDGLYRNPWGFYTIENDWVRIRFVITKPTAILPPLIVSFGIEENNDVILLYVEESETY
jgi:hypothetical protein